jgi:hypothetical protein
MTWTSGPCLPAPVPAFRRHMWALDTAIGWSLFAYCSGVYLRGHRWAGWAICAFAGLALSSLFLNLWHQLIAAGYQR